MSFLDRVRMITGSNDEPKQDPISRQYDYVKLMIKGTFPELSLNENLTKYSVANNLIFDYKDGDFNIEIGVLYDGSDRKNFIYRSFKREGGKTIKVGKEVKSISNSSVFDSLNSLSKEIEKLLNPRHKPANFRPVKIGRI